MNNLVTDSLSIHEQANQSTNVWLWIAIIELFIILYLAGRLMNNSRKERKDIKDKLKAEPIDFGNTINSAFNSKSLYDKLKVKYHPDRFVNTPLQEEANAIFQEIQANRYNYNKLKELEEKAVKTLHINF